MTMAQVLCPPPFRSFNAPDAARRQVRQELRERNLAVQRNKEVLCDITSNKLNDEIKNLNMMLDRVGELKAKEAHADADCFRQLAECGAEASKKLLRAQQGRGPLELVRALRAAFVHTSDPQRDGEEDPSAFCWNELGGSVRHMFRPAPGANCMLGPLDARPKERAAPAPRAARKRKEPTGPAVRPEELQELGQGQGQEKKETDRNLELMHGVIKELEDQLIPAYKLVLDHGSFAKTIENMFTLSFLVRDNWVALVGDKQRGLCVRANGARRGAATSGKAAMQFIISMHMHDWERMKRVVRPEECLMPQLAAMGASDQGQEQQEEATTNTGRKKQRAAN